MNKPSLSDPQVRSKLAKLKKLGLYNGNLRRKQPTRYGKSVVDKYMDVLEGKASVVTVKPARAKGKKQTKGYKEARQEFGETQRVVRNKVVVKTRRGEKARYAPKKKDIQVTSSDDYYAWRKTVLKKRIYTREDIPTLKANQRFRVPFNRNGETEWISFVGPDAADELWSMMREYEGRYKNIGAYVELQTGKKKRSLNDDDDTDQE